MIIAPGLNIFLIFPIIVLLLILIFIISNLFARNRLKKLEKDGIIETNDFSCLPGQVAWASLILSIVFTIIPKLYIVGIATALFFNLWFFHNTDKTQLKMRQDLVKYLGPQYFFIVGLVLAIFLPMFGSNNI